MPRYTQTQADRQTTESEVCFIYVDITVKIILIYDIRIYIYYNIYF